MKRFAVAVSLVSGVVSVGCGALEPSSQPESVDVVTSAIVTTPVKIDCGSKAAVAPFDADKSFNGGTAISHANPIDLSQAVGAAPVTVYQTARTGNITYTLTGFANQVSAKVRLHFAETYFDLAGKRTFDIAINDAPVKSGFDIIGAAGGKNVAFILENTVNADANGTIKIAFTSLVNNSLISAIEVIPSTCTAGAACTPGGNVCQLGKTSCATGTATCMATGNVANGTSCGTAKVCSNGACATCAAGAACAPPNVCHAGTVSCATGAATCVDTGMNMANGTSCGTAKVCSNGACATCAAGAACMPTNVCHAGTVSCATGTATCADTGTNLANGTSCGNGKVCSNGVCAAPVSG
ncbi:MAG: Di-glucose binding within endoplasmic reticulum [Myxococcales bacterium]|nr:Di-glucose binding within endoplasmic reticulum [Myxococcales bacterium]